MKKIILLLGAAVFALSSCNKNDGPEITPQYYFCYDFLVAQGIAQDFCDIANYYVKEYKAGTAHDEMAAATETDGSTTLTITFTSGSTSYSLSGTMRVNINDNLGSDVKTITLNGLKDNNQTTAYGGTITVTDILVDDNTRDENVELAGFSIGGVGSSTPSILMNYIYEHQLTGLSTTDKTDDKAYWMNGAVNGTHAQYGAFTGMMNDQFTAGYVYSAGQMTYISGDMTFTVQNFGGVVTPVRMTLTNAQLSITYNGSTINY